MSGVSNIVLPTSESCPFCAFLRGEKPYTILRRSELVAILVTREQRGVSHLLVVPVRHCPTILDLGDEESGALMSEIRHAARIVDAAEKRQGSRSGRTTGYRPLRPLRMCISMWRARLRRAAPGGVRCRCYP